MGISVNCSCSPKERTLRQCSEAELPFLAQNIFLYNLKICDHNLGYFVVKTCLHFRIRLKDTGCQRKWKPPYERDLFTIIYLLFILGHYLPPLLTLLLRQPITFVEKSACVRCPFYGSDCGRRLWEHERAMSVEVTLCDRFCAWFVNIAWIY